MAGLDWDASDFMKGLDKFGKLSEEGMRDGMEEAGEVWLELSQREVPHDEGTLANSGETHREGDGQVVGYHTEYAAIVHEDTKRNYQKGRKAKYLEDPAKNNLPKFLEIIGTAVKRRL